MKNSTPRTTTSHFILTKKMTLLATTIQALAATAAFAQDSGENLEHNFLEEVIVTARKRSENLQQVPLSVSAISAEELAINGTANIGDIQSQIPGLTAYAARGTSSTLTAYIRGVGQSDPLYGVEPGVGLYLDDVYIARPQGALLEVFDVEHIEVLRGPQGTLYGRNTIGGAIKYVSKSLTNEQEGKVQVTIGDYGRKDITLSYAMPLIENELYAKVALASAYRDGFGENNLTGDDISDKQVTSGRMVLQWDASDALSVKLTADATKDTSAPRSGQRMIENPWEATIPAMMALTPGAVLGGLPVYFAANVDGFVAANNLLPLPVSNDRYDTDSGLQGARNDVNTYGGSLIMDYRVNESWDIKSITAYRNGDTNTTIDFDMGPLPIADVFAKYDDRQLTQEFQFNYDNGGKLQAIMGLYYIDATAGGDGYNQFLLAPVYPAGHPLNPTPVAITAIVPKYAASSGAVSTLSYSLYGEASWEVSERLSLTFGARYNWENKEVTTLAQDYSDANFTTVITTETDFTDDETWTNFSPKLGLDYKINDNTMIYGSISRGFKSGGFNVRAKQNSNPESIKPYDEETVTAYEVGLKSTLFERIIINASYFYSDYEDIQLSIFSQSNDGTFFGDFTNAGEGVIQGVEVEFTAALTENFSLSGNLAFLDADYKKYLDGGVDVSSDREFTNAPEWTGTINATYAHSFSDGSDLIARLSYSYRDDIIPTTDLSEIIAQDAYGTVDATIAYTTAAGSWRLALEGRNLTDEQYRTTGYDLRSSGAPIVQGFYGDPRTLALKIGYEF